MKRYERLTLLFVLLCATLSVAQNTTVNLNVTDTDAQAWANGTYELDIYSPPGVPQNGNYLVNGSALSPVKYTGSLDGNGNASLSVTSNTSILPAGTQWMFQVCPQATSQCFNQAVSISGASQSVNLAPPGIRVGPLGRVVAYADTEIQAPSIGNCYYNLVSTVTRCYNGTSWVVSGGGGVGTPGGANGSLQYNASGVLGGSTAWSATSTAITAGATGSLDLHAITSTSSFLLPGAFGTGFVRVTTTTGAVTSGEVSGDCTTNASFAITCTKTNGTVFAPSATTDTTNAANITSGTLPAGRISVAGFIGGTNGQLEFNNSSVFGGVTGSSVSGANVTLAGSLILNATANIPNGVLQVNTTDLGSPGLVVNTPLSSTADIADFNNNNVKQVYIDKDGETHFQASSTTSASFNMPFGTAPTTPVVGDFWFAQPNLLEYWDSNGTLEDVAATNIQNVFQQLNTFQQHSATQQAIVITAAPSPSADILQVRDSASNVKIEFTPDFGIIASYFKTNGTVSGTQEFVTTGTDPLGSFALDTGAFRFDAPTSITTSFRVTLPSVAYGAATPAVWLFNTGCASQTVLSNSAITCPSSIGQVPNAALANSSITINSVALTLGGTFNLGQLNDSNGHPTVESTATASAVDFLCVVNGIGTITLQACGSSTNISINIASKNTGTVQCNSLSCGGGGGGGTQIATNGTVIPGSEANFETSASLIGTPSTQVAKANNNGDSIGVQFVSDTSTPNTNVVGYISGFMPTPHYRRIAWLAASGSGWSNMGDTQAITGTNSGFPASATDPNMMNEATSGTSGSNAGVIGNAVLRSGANRNIHFQTYLELPNQASGSIRAWWGVTNTSIANMNGSDTPLFSFAAFRYSTVATDTTYKCVVGNGTTTTVKDTTITADAVGHYYDIIFDDTTGNIQCVVDGVVKATFANTDAVPGNINLAQFDSIQTETTATQNIRAAWLYSTSDK